MSRLTGATAKRLRTFQRTTACDHLVPVGGRPFHDVLQGLVQRNLARTVLHEEVVTRVVPRPELAGSINGWGRDIV